MHSVVILVAVVLVKANVTLAQQNGRCQSSSDCPPKMCCSPWGFCGGSQHYCTSNVPTTATQSSTTSSAAVETIPWNVVQQPADFTYYNDAGYGACGTRIDASSQMLVAVSWLWWTSNNPNNDRLCARDVCVKVTFNNRSVIVPVLDKCPSCQRQHLDLSQPAFAKLADLAVGHVYDAEWTFVKC